MTPTCCKRMKRVTDGNYYLLSFSLLAQHHSHARICTYSMSEILDWPPAVITTSGTSSHSNLPNTMFPHSSVFVWLNTESIHPYYHFHTNISLWLLIRFFKPQKKKRAVHFIPIVRQPVVCHVHQYEQGTLQNSDHILHQTTSRRHSMFQ